MRGGIVARMRMWGIWAGILLIFLLRVGMGTGVVGVRIMVVDIMEASSESGEMAAVVVEEEMAVDAEEVVETVAVEEEEGVAEY